MAWLPYFITAWVCACGLYGIVTSKHLVHLIMCLIVVQSSTYLLLIAVGFKNGGFAPYFSDISSHVRAVDPVVQALTLTDIVVEAAVSALLLSLALRAHRRFGSVDPEELRHLRG